MPLKVTLVSERSCSVDPLFRVSLPEAVPSAVDAVVKLEVLPLLACNCSVPPLLTEVVAEEPLLLAAAQDERAAADRGISGVGIVAAENQSAGANLGKAVRGRSAKIPDASSCR